MVDYDDTSSLKAKVARLAGVEASRVTIVITPGSVLLTASIDVPAGTAAAVVQSTLVSSLGATADDASAALGITVE